MQQHIRDCRYKSENSGTALSEHHFELKHNFDFDQAKILDYESHYHKRNISEMTNIVLKKNRTVNHRTDVFGLSNLYFNLLHNYGNTQQS